MARVKRKFLANIVLSITDNVKNPRTYYTKITREHGGRFSYNITKGGVTHLIATKGDVDEENPKIAEAAKRSIYVVTEAWLEDSIAQGTAQTETKYNLIPSDDDVEMGEGQQEEEEEEDEEKELEPESTQDSLKQKENKIQRNFNTTFKSLFDDKETADVIIKVTSAPIIHKEIKKIPIKQSKAKKGKSSRSKKEEEEEEQEAPENKEEISNSQQFYVHSFIVSTHSPVLRKLIKESTTKEEGKTVVELKLDSIELFETLLHSIYIGTISEEEEETKISLVELYEQFGMEAFAFWLQTSFWTSKNICMLLEKQIKSNAKRSSEFQEHRLQTLKTFFCKQASAAVKSDTFKLLSKATLIDLLSSDELEINELDLFQAVLQWIDNAVSIEPEQSRFAKRQQYYNDLLPKIRFPLMNVEDLIVHVEPLKFIPKEYLLEAYRILAVDLSPRDWSSERCRPRGLSKPGWIKETWFRQINQWISQITKQHITIGKVLFSSERDDMTNEKFHEKCDSQGPTIAIAKSGKFVFGGFTMHSWGTQSNTNGYGNDKFAFIFSLSDGKKRKPEKFVPVTNKRLSIYDIQSSGPTWGGGHDLHFNLSGQSYSNLGHTYQLPKGLTYGDNSSALYFAGSKNFSLDQIVIFQGRKQE